MKFLKLTLSTLVALFVGVTSLSAEEYKVSLDQVATTLKTAKAGDKIVIKSGTYTDQLLKWVATGTEKQPITIVAEEPGSVKIEGASSLRIAGEWLVVDGLHFRNGCQPSGAVIEYRNGSKNLANNCRVTNTVIENYNPKFRGSSSSYVVLYGRYNRFDHSSLVGKKSLGVTMIVMLNDERCIENYHRIDHNYFGHRPVYGSNGAETFRAGTSHQAYSSSRTIIEDNIFERCNGEVEVVSIKSSDNIIRRNTFIESEGVLALRHGDRNEAYDNLFLGRGKRNTGGIRIINAHHKVYNNTFVEVAGTRFFAAMALMNAVPNSLPNRYCLVEDVLVKSNAFYDCALVEFGTGADEERTWAVKDVTFQDNIISNKNLTAPYSALSSVDEVTFKGNVVDLAESYKAEGFKSKKIQPFEMPAEEVIRTGKGAAWWSEVVVEVPASPTVYSVKAGDDLPSIVAAAEPFSVVELTEAGGDYAIASAMVVKCPLTIRAKAGLAKRPIVRFNGTSGDNMVTIADGGDLHIEGIEFSGVLEPGKSLASAGISSDDVMIESYNLVVDNCEFVDFNEGRFFCIRGTKSTFAQKIEVRNSQFRNLSGDAINFAAERDDIGRYNAEEMIIEGCSFQRLLGIPINIYRGGSDESTAGPFVVIKGCNFEDSCNRERGSVIRMMGPQVAVIEDCNFSNSGRGAFSVRLDETNFEDVKVRNCNFFNSGGVLSMTGKVVEGELTALEPQYNNPDAFDFSIKEGSELHKIGVGIIK